MQEQSRIEQILAHQRGFVLLIHERAMFDAKNASRMAEIERWQYMCPLGKYMLIREMTAEQAIKNAAAEKKAAAEARKNWVDPASEDERLENILDVLVDMAEEKGSIRMLEIGKLLAADRINNSANINFLKSALQDEGFRVIA